MLSMAEQQTAPEISTDESLTKSGRAVATLRWLQHHLKVVGAIITLLGTIGLVIKGLLGYVDVYHLATGFVTPAHTISMSNAPTAPVANVARLSIAVFPFDDISPEADRENLARAITQAVEVYLSQVPDCVAKYVSGVDLQKGITLRKQLGVNYVLRGSIQRFGNNVRISAELIDANDGTQLWTDHFEDSDRNVFDLEDAIAGRISNSLDIEMIKAANARVDMEKPLLKNADYYAIKGRFAFHKLRTKENLQEAQGFFRQALVLNPNQSDALAFMPLALVFEILNFPDAEREQKAALAMQIADKAVQLSPMSGVAHGAKAQSFTPYGRYPEWIQECETALSLNPNLSQPLTLLAAGKFRTGEFEAAIAAGKRAMRVSPKDPGIAFAPLHIGNSYAAIHDYVNADKYLELVRATSPLVWRPHASLAVVYALQGNAEAAHDELAEARRLNPALTVKLYEQTLRFKKPPIPSKEARFIEFSDASTKALRDLGLPEK